MAEQGHTPTPWRAHKQWVNGPNRVTIATTFQGGSSHHEVPLRVSDAEADANAAFIVRACNCHDALLAACQAVIRCTVCDCRNFDAEPCPHCQAQAAIASATPKDEAPATSEEGA